MTKTDQGPRSDIIELKQRVRDEMAAHHEACKEIALRLHANPEVGYEEHQASGWLSEYLEQNGFSVERGISGLPTAFRARYGSGKPEIAILAEYDALPEVGHGCGHNLIAASAIGAGVTSKTAVDRFGGSVLVFGTPAEELGGRAGKITMVDEGAFDTIDAAMMVHPSWIDVASINNKSLESLTVEFHGRSAHAGAMPQSGVNALEAMITAFNAINSLRQRLTHQGAIHGIITAGGKAANMIPDYSAAEFMIRSEDDAMLDELKELVLQCFRGAAAARGAELTYRWGKRMLGMRYNRALAHLFADNMEPLGHHMEFMERTSFASSDVGNISRRVPTIQALVKAVPEGTTGHSNEMARAVATDDAIDAMLRAATGMALTVVDLLGEPGNLAKLREEQNNAP
jgi:amidohydrolase